MDDRQVLRDPSEGAPNQLTQYHQLMLDLSVSFINLPQEELAPAIDLALSRMATFFDADRAYVFRYDFLAGTGTNTHEWCAPGIKPVIGQLQDIPNEAGFLELVDAHRQGQPFLVVDTDQLPDGSLRDLLQPQGVKSLISAPLMNGNECIGFVGFDSVRRERRFSEGEYDLLSLFANLLVNIEQRKEAADALQQARYHQDLANKRFLNILDGTLAAVYVADMETYEILFVNRYARELLGDVVGKSCWRHLQGRTDGPCDFCTNSRLLNNEGTPAPPVIWERYNPLIQRWFLLTDQAIAWEDGRYVRMEIAFDITERKMAEEAVRQSELRYRSLFDNSRDALLIVAPPDWQIITCNTATLRLFGYEDEASIKQASLEVLSPPTQADGRNSMEAAREYLARAMETGNCFFEWQHRHRDGRILECSVLLNRAEWSGQTVIQGTFRDISPRKAAERALEQRTEEVTRANRDLERIAHYDTVTQLPNRVLLARDLRRAMARADRQGSLIAIAYLDLDGFKAINDRYGHEMGDRLLTELAGNMKLAMREEDTLARLGGDEFVAVFTSIESEDALHVVLHRLLKAASLPVDILGFRLGVSASLGVTLYPQAGVQDADQLLRQADQAMYQAKVSGKNRFVVFDTQQHQALVGHHEQVARIRQALECHEFVLYYQPKVNMRTGELTGVEALIRWQHPDQGLLPPTEFLPVIESHPLSVELDGWVLREALAQINRWSEQGQPLSVSINLSAETLQHGQFVSMLEDSLASWPSSTAGLLEIEVLESSALDDIETVSDMIRRCRALGVRFSLDDFGVGYSSLTYLKRLPANTLKIDRSFVRNMLNDDDDLTILKGICGLASAFGLDVIAEGVEAEAHGARLLELGVDHAQGYGIARPMPAEQVTGWWSGWRPPASWQQRAGKI